MLDRQDILDCQVRFSRAMDRFDRELFLGRLFYPDAVIAAGPFVGDPVSLYDWASKLHDHGQSATHHNLLNHTCDLDGDVAHTETYYLFVGRNRDETNWIAGGRYIDRLERRAGAWKIALRTNAIEWSGMVPTLPIPFWGCAGYSFERRSVTQSAGSVVSAAADQPAGGEDSGLLKLALSVM